jgi:hypothetical protein
MTQNDLIESAKQEISSPASPVSALTGAFGGGLGALYASLARLTLVGLENLSDRRAESRALRLSARAKALQDTRA